jgi:hypothetical protein
VRETRILLDEFANLIPISHGHEDIGQDKVGRNIGESANGCVAVVYRNNLNTQFSQSQSHCLLDVAIIVGYQDLCHGPSSRLLRARMSRFVRGHKRAYSIGNIMIQVSQ